MAWGRHVTSGLAYDGTARESGPRLRSTAARCAVGRAWRACMWRTCGVEGGRLLGAGGYGCLPRAAMHHAPAHLHICPPPNFPRGRPRALLCFACVPHCVHFGILLPALASAALPSYNVRHITPSHPLLYHHPRLHHECAGAQWTPVRAQFAQQSFCQECIHSCIRPEPPEPPTFRPHLVTACRSRTRHGPFTPSFPHKPHLLHHRP